MAKHSAIWSTLETFLTTENSNDEETGQLPSMKSCLDILSIDSKALLTYKAAQSRGLTLGPVFKNASCTMRLTSFLLFVFARSPETSSGLIALIRFRGVPRSPVDRLNVLPGDSVAPDANEVAFMRLES